MRNCTLIKRLVTAVYLRLPAIRTSHSSHPGLKPIRVHLSWTTKNPAGAGFIASAVTAEQTDAVTFAHREVNLVQKDVSAVVQRDFIQLQERYAQLYAKTKGRPTAAAHCNH